MLLEPVSLVIESSRHGSEQFSSLLGRPGGDCHSSPGVLFWKISLRYQRWREIFLPPALQQDASLSGVRFGLVVVHLCIYLNFLPAFTTLYSSPVTQPKNPDTSVVPPICQTFLYWAFVLTPTLFGYSSPASAAPVPSQF